MWSLLKIELFKVFKRPRTYIAFVAVFAIISLLQIALYIDGPKYVEFVLQAVKDNFDIKGKIVNGYFVCFIILQTLLIHVPLLVALVSADMIAGEANMGTLRLLITKPVSRTKLLLSKFMASSVYTIALLLWIAFLGLLVSMLIFGTDGLVNAKSDDIVLLNENDIFWRYLCAFVFAAFALLTVAALGFFFSIFAENSLGPIVATMSVIIVFTILTTLDIPFFNSIKQYLFTTHMIGWKGFFEMKTDADGYALPGTIRNLPAVLRSGGVLLGHIVLFVGSAIFIFNRKDVLS